MRELENVIERAVILSTGKTLSFDRAWLTPEEAAPASASAERAGEEGTLAEMEKRHIRRALEKSQWRIAGKGGAAEQLGLKPSTLRSRMDKLGLERESKGN